MLPYTQFAAIALFILIARNHERFRTSVVAAYAVIPVFILESITVWIGFGKEVLALTLVAGGGIIGLALQYAVAFFIFHKIKENNDNLAVYFGWVFAGWPLIYLLVPLLVVNTLRLFGL